MSGFDLPQERRQHIQEKLKQEGKVVASELSQLFGVSEDTIRRDLRELADQGLLKRVHGGGLPLAPGAAPYAVRQQRVYDSQTELARLAAQYVCDGQVLIMGSGTTNHEIAKHLKPDLRATIITVSPQIAVTLSDLPYVEVILIGGRLNKQEMVVIDAEAVHQIKRFNADLCFLGICSLHPELGYTATLYEEVAVKQAAIQQSGEVFAVAVTDKIGTVAPFFVAPLTEITHLVTESQIAEETLAPYREAGIEIITAG